MIVDGLQCFHEFLKSEFSEENLEFWIACEEFKKTAKMTNMQQLTAQAQKIFSEFVANGAYREVSDFTDQKINAAVNFCTFKSN